MCFQPFFMLLCRLQTAAVRTLCSIVAPSCSTAHDMSCWPAVHGIDNGPDEKLFCLELMLPNEM